MSKFILQTSKTINLKVPKVFPIFQNDLNESLLINTLKFSPQTARQILNFFKGKLGDFFTTVHPNGEVFILFGLDKKDIYIDGFTLFKAFSILARNLQLKAIDEFYLVITKSLINITADSDQTIIQIIKGINNGFYKFLKYITITTNGIKPLKTCHLLLENSNSAYIGRVKKVLNFANKLVKWINYSKDHINEHSSNLTPARFAQELIDTAKKLKLKTKLLTKSELEKNKLGGILGVGRGSCHPPLLLIIENITNKNERPLALIGKSVTFDSGGISIKPREGLDEMKYDMSGGSIVASSTFLAKDINQKSNFVALLPIVENVPSHSSFKPGDIIEVYGGKTVEVIDTDAEGRIILADAIEYAKKNYNPQAIVTVATLTGACIVALSNWVAGLFTNNKNLAQKIKKASQISGERIWQLPIYDEHREQNKSQIADIKNLGGRPGGAITAAAFLEFFAKDYPFLHLDIAGTAFYSQDTLWQEKGATGFGVNLLTEFIKE